ncbi:MAG TPA: Gfo/Idh/MocA family oxidoreductase [Halanaerobiales bacterium]|nr:Gfo/Idh/MocA family oxidoreductase [Halanaerobiales bacterium]
MIEGKENEMSSGVLKYGMVGGGSGSFIGGVHRKAAVFDNKACLVAGCFSRDYQNTKNTGKSLGLTEDRLYETYAEMAEQEAQREDPIDFVSIVTPNHLHYDVAKKFLEAGINVVCDKPLTFTYQEAEELDKLARENELLFCVTYTYTGYPMVKHAREVVKRGDIGDIRVVIGEYSQDWLATLAEKEGNKQAAWRTDPKKAGRANCVGDIGSHLENMVSYITELEIDSLCANLDHFGKGRELDDNAEILVKYKGGATGVYWCSQVAVGHDNDLKVRIYGTNGSIEWHQEEPNKLKISYLDKPTEILSRGRDELYPLANDLPRIPAGHPEGYFVAFSNIYTSFEETLLDKKSGTAYQDLNIKFPTAREGAQGVKFINKTVDSDEANSTWVKC